MDVKHHVYLLEKGELTLGMEPTSSTACKPQGGLTAGPDRLTTLSSFRGLQLLLAECASAVCVCVCVCACACVCVCVCARACVCVCVRRENGG